MNLSIATKALLVLIAARPRGTGARKDAADVGAVVTASAPFSRTVRRLAAACQGESVVCENGFVTGTFGTDDQQTCEDACDSKCCVGTLACEGFTGEVCADEISCVGNLACYDATIDLVVAGCGGYNACFRVGFDFSGNGASIGEINHSCNDEYACYYAASNNGAIERIIHSCNGYKACVSAASSNGSIDQIIESCNDNKACYFAANDKGAIEGITNSCNGLNACNKAAADSGEICGIRDGCNAENACFKAGMEASVVCPGINDCCNTIIEACASATTTPVTCSTAPDPQCYEKGWSRFFTRTRNGNEQSMTCKGLSKKGVRAIKKWCAETAVGDKHGTAKDACPVTCNLCPGGCNEIGGQLFYLRTRNNGKILKKKCNWLKDKTPYQLNKFCNKKAPEGHLNGAQACPVSCKTCDEL